MKLNNKRGFTLIEVIVVAGIIAILAGILVPMIFNQIDESRITRAQADVKSTATAILAFRKDTGKWPSFSAGTYPCNSPANGGDASVISILNSDGKSPSITGAGWADITTSLRYNLLFQENPTTKGNNCYPNPVNQASTGWKGPYLTSYQSDPWGNQYIINSADFEIQGNGVWVISAGPDGIVQTGALENSLVGDDIGVKVK